MYQMHGLKCAFLCGSPKWFYFFKQYVRENIDTQTYRQPKIKVNTRKQIAYDQATRLFLGFVFCYKKVKQVYKNRMLYYKKY